MLQLINLEDLVSKTRIMHTHTHTHTTHTHNRVWTKKEGRKELVVSKP